MYDVVLIFFFKQKTAYEMRISDWSSDVCSSDLKFTPMEIEKLADEFEAKSAQDVLKWALDTFGTKIGLASSFGAEDVVIIDMKIGRASCRERVCQYV